MREISRSKVKSTYVSSEIQMLLIEAAGTKFIHTIILMHGARAKITAKDYAVLNIVRIGGEYSIKKDGTVIVL